MLPEFTHSDGGEERRREEGESRFPARRNLRYIPIHTRPRESDPPRPPVVEAARLLKSGDAAAAPSPHESDNTIHDQLSRMDQRIRHLLGLLGNGGRAQSQESRPPVSEDSTPPSAQALPIDNDDEPRMLMLRLRGYYQEWASLLMEEEGPAESLAGFAQSSYVDLLERHFSLCFMLLDLDSNLLRVCHASHFPAAGPAPAPGTRIKLDEHSLESWVLLSDESADLQLAAMRFALNGGSLLIFPRKLPGSGIQPL